MKNENSIHSTINNREDKFLSNEIGGFKIVNAGALSSTDKTITSSTRKFSMADIRYLVYLFYRDGGIPLNINEHLVPIISIPHDFAIDLIHDSLFKETILFSPLHCTTCSALRDGSFIEGAFVMIDESISQVWIKGENFYSTIELEQIPLPTPADSFGVKNDRNYYRVDDVLIYLFDFFRNYLRLAFMKVIK